MKALVLLAAGALVGCGVSFSNPLPADFAFSATRAASVLAPQASSAEKYAVSVPATALIAASDAGGNNLLLDYANQASDGLEASRGCGPVAVVDGSTGVAKWSHARKGTCPSTASALLSGYLTVENLEEGKARYALLTILDRATGATKVSVRAATVVGLDSVGDDVLSLEGSPAERSIVLRAGDSLKERWRVKLTKDESVGKGGTEIASVSVAAGVVYAVGVNIVLAIDAKTGQRLGRAKLVSEVVLTPVPYPGGLFVTTTAGADKQPSVSAIGPRGEVRWTAKGKLLALATSDLAVLATEQEIFLTQAQDGATKWSVKLPSPLAGRPVYADETTLLVPHQQGVTALDIASGGEKFSVAVPAGAPATRHADRLSVETDGLIVWDSWKHLVAFDHLGALRWSFDVRSLPLAHRDGRQQQANAAVIYRNNQYNSAAAFNLAFSSAPPSSTGLAPNGAISTQSVGVGMAMSIGAAQMAAATADYVNARNQGVLNAMYALIATRRGASVAATERLAMVSVWSPFVIRPITWNLGRGYLVVRKSDGAFAEIVTGTSDLYDEMWREVSMAAFLPDAKTLVTFTEGLSSKDWKLHDNDSQIVKLVERRLTGFAVDPATFKPASEYPTTSKVPDGSYLWRDDVRAH